MLCPWPRERERKDEDRRGLSHAPLSLYLLALAHRSPDRFGARSFLDERGKRVDPYRRDGASATAVRAG